MEIIGRLDLWMILAEVLGTILLLASFTRNNIYELRVLNLVGSVLFIVVYGIYKGEWGVTIKCLIASIIHSYRLAMMFRQGL